jgi:glyoxylase-like metal-dependent hydrolase (beta-lactamase superfamily II)
MVKTRVLLAILVTLLPTIAVAQDVKTLIADVSTVMGMNGLNSITYSGGAGQGNFGQSRTISFGLATTTIRNYTRTIDFTQPALRATGITMPPAVRGGPPPQAGTLDQLISPATPAWPQQFQIWVTPWGFVRGAAANAATVRKRSVDGVEYRVVSWVPPQKAPSGQPYKVVGYIGPQNLVDKVETWVEHPIFGDMHVEVWYTNYQDMNGLNVPGTTRMRQQGMETFVLTTAAARANPPNLNDLMTGPMPGVPPAPARAGGPGAPAPSGVEGPQTAASEKLAEGVYRITGGYVSLAVEFKDHVVVLEGGQNEARGLAIIAETKRLFPSKRIKYVVLTHPHFDHAGGLPPFVAEGVTLLVDDNSKFFVEASLSQPRTLVGDTLGKTKKKPKVEGVIDKMVLQDETRTLELHHVKDLEHSDAMLIAFLPKEKILFTADFNIPAPGQPVSPSIATLIANIERLRLDFDRYVTVHPPNPDRPLTKADVMALAKGTN